MIRKIKEILKKNKTLYMVYKIFKDKNYKSYCMDYYANGTIFRFEHLGNENGGKNIYFIGEGSSIQGMFSLILWTLRRLEVADKFRFTPVVSWTKDVPVNYNDNPNPFLIYFQQTSDVAEDTINKSADIAFSKRWDQVYDKPRIGYDFSQDEVCRLAKIYKRYIKLQPVVQEKMDSDSKQLFGGTSGKKVLGVHVRGVEWRKKQVFGHPIPISVQDYLEAAQKLIDELEYDKIFLATDSEETVELFKNNFGDKLIEYHAVRTPVGSSQLSIFNDKNNPFQMGYEVLRDAYTLASCDSLLCGLSNVSYVTRIIKQSTESNYEKIVILDKGKVEDGLSLTEVEKWQRKY